MKCTNCGYENAAGTGSCTYCNHTLSSASSATVSTAPPNSCAHAPASPSSATTPVNTASPTPSSPSAYSASSPSGRIGSSYSYPQPYYYPTYPTKEKQPFTITDAYIIIGFVLVIVGVFSYSFILLPASIGFSIVGFVKRTNARTLGLSIAGIVVGVVACLIKVGMVLNELGVIPDWLSAGIF